MRSGQIKSSALSRDRSWYSLDQVTWVVFGIIGVLLVILTYRKQLNALSASDLEVYLHTARLMLEEKNIYTLASENGRFYRYPPLFAFICTPLVYLPFKWALLVWTLLNTILISAVFLIWYRVVADRRFLEEQSLAQLFVAGISLIVLLRYLLSHLYLGQANLFLLFVLVLSYVLISSQRTVLGGLLLGGSMLLKPFAVPFLIWYLVSARLRILAASATGIIVGAILPAIVVGIDKNWSYMVSWVEHMMQQTPQGVWSASNNVSLYVSMRRLFTDMHFLHLDSTSSTVSVLSLSDLSAQIMTFGMFIALLLWIGYVGYKYGRSSQSYMHPAVASFIFALIVALTTTAQKHYFVVMLPALVYVLHTWYVRRYKDALFRVLVIASFILLVATGPLFWPRALVRTFQAIGLLPLGAVLLAAAIHRSLRHWDSICARR